MDDLNIRFDWLEVLPNNTEDRIQIPILGPIDSSTPLSKLKSNRTFEAAEKERDAVEIARSLLPVREKGNDLFALEVKGNSLMDAMIHDGDIVVMKPASDARDGEMVVVWLSRDNGTTLKYFYKEKDGYRLQPANPKMKPIFLKKDEPLEITGKVVMVIRKLDRPTVSP